MSVNPDSRAAGRTGNHPPRAWTGPGGRSGRTRSHTRARGAEGRRTGDFKEKGKEMAMATSARER